MIRRFPRICAALAFGSFTSLAAHLVWVPAARLGGVVPWLTLGAGVAHAVVGGALGPRLIDPVRTPTLARASLRGAQISLLAQLLFTLPFSFWIRASNTAHQGIVAGFAFPVLVAFFGFVAVGWVLCIVSACVGVSLHWLARRALPDSPHSTAGSTR